MREFIVKIDQTEALHRVSATVDPLLEIAAITDRCCKSLHDNVALLFENVKGSRYRVATNLFGSEQRMSLSLGKESLTELTDWFDSILTPLEGGTSTEKLASLARSSIWKAAAPIIESGKSLFTDAGVKPDLSQLPLLRSYPGDGSPVHAGLFMTLPVVITASPEGELNCGMYRAAVASPDTLAISWSSSSGAARHAAAWESRQEPMPVVIALGVSPSLTFAATLPLPEYLDEFSFAGLLQREPLKLRTCGNGLPVPVDAELVIEGYLHPGETVSGGAFGNHTGFYTPAEPAAAVRVTAVTCKQDMICPATIVGRPPMEDCWLAVAAGRLFLSLLKIDVPEVADLCQPLAGIFHGGTIISVRTTRGSSEDLVGRIRNMAFFRASRLIVIVDEEQDPADFNGVYWRVMNSVNWERDTVIHGQLLLIDARDKAVDARKRVVPDQTVALLVAKRWREYGF